MILQALAQPAEAIVIELGELVPILRRVRPHRPREPLDEPVFIIITVSSRTVDEHVPIGVVLGYDRVWRPNVLIFAVNGELGGRAVIGAPIQVPGGIITVAAVL